MEVIKKFNFAYSKPDYPELFKIITYPGIKPNMYMISNHGKVFNIKKKIIMKTYFDKDYHERITLVTTIKNKKGNKSKHYFIHRLMMWEFVGPPPDEYHNVVNHKNGIPCCNFIHNLEWTSVLENTNHAKRIGLMNNSGINSSSSKYSEKLIRRICSLFEEGYTNKEIFEIMTCNKNIHEKPYNKIYSLIYKLGKRIIYRDIVKDYDYLPDESFFNTDKSIENIRKMIKEGKTNIEILHEFGFKDYSENRRFYNRIIYERAKCDVLFNDYRKHSI